MSAYINPIANGITVSLLIIYLGFIPVLIYQYRKYGAFPLRKNIVLTSFVVYMITAFFMTLLPLPSIETVKNMEPVKANYYPFLFIKTFLNNSGFIWNEISTWFRALYSPSFYTVAFNFLLTLPFGVYLRKYFKQGLPGVTILGFLLSLFYEATQFTGIWGVYPQAFRLADVDDLIVNTMGTVIGFYVGGILNQLLPDPMKDKTLQTERASLFRRLLSLFIDSIFVNVLFEMLRVIALLLTGNKQDLIDIFLFIISSAIVFMLFPFISKKNRTLGMSILNLSLKDGTGNNPKFSKIILHNLFIGLWINLIPNSINMINNDVVIMLLELIVLGILLVMIILSIKNRKITYFWEHTFDTYIKADKNINLRHDSQ